jgi:nucleoside transporter
MVQKFENQNILIIKTTFMSRSIQIQLSTMMFLQFFVWGAWFVTLGTFMEKNMMATAMESGTAYSTQSWGAIIAPFIIGLIADRYFNAEKILGFLHIAGAILLYNMAGASNFDAFYPYVLGYMIAYMPTLALVNSVAFNQMKDPSKEFSFIRVFGTIGWIVAGLMISFVFKWDSQDMIANGALKNTFMMAAVAAAALGLLSFTLPATPPKGNNGEKVSLSNILGLDALKLLADRNYLIFFASSILICIPLAFYYNYTNPFLVNAGMENPTGKMTIGQMSEVGFMLLLPFFFKRFGFKTTIIVGMLAWALRYVMFAFGDAGSLSLMLIVGIALHGICYDFFFVSGQIYTNAKAGDNIKSAAQGLITLATYGIGMLIGFWAAGQIVNANANDWQTIWLYPAAFAAVIMLVFAVSFRNENIEYQE